MIAELKSVPRAMLFELLEGCYRLYDLATGRCLDANCREPAQPHRAWCAWHDR